MITLLLRLIVTAVIAFFVGKLISKIKLPSILGWLITGMILGPHAFSLMNENLLSASWYQTTMHILECAVGLMIGTELVWNKIKQSGKSIIITTITQSIGTFILVSLVFGVVFHFTGIPLYLAFIFGGIALATAPAPALSIVREFRTDGPVTATLIPMAALDDIVGCVVFFTTIAVVAGNLSAGQLPAYMIALVVLLPLAIGVVTGFFAGLLLKKERDNSSTLVILTATILITSVVGFIVNGMLPRPILNFMLIGMAFSATFANMVTEERLEQIMTLFNPFLGVAMILVILNLGAPLDYHLILGAGAFTAIYIVTRALGKYFGAFFGASITKSPKTVRNYLGLTLLPHSGVSLVFTGIAVSVLAAPAPECASIVQGTIAAAAVINEIIAVIMAKKGFEWAGEFNKDFADEVEITPTSAPRQTIITISRQYGSGGRAIGKRLAEELGIPFYDHELIELAAESSTISKNAFEKSESTGVGSLLYDLAMNPHSQLSLDDKVFLHQSKVISEIAQKGSCVIVGRCADYVLKHYSNVLKVFIYADIETRKHTITEVYKESSAREAMEKITKADRQRISYYNYYTGQKYGEAKNYNLCLDSSTIGIDNCVAIIKSAYENASK